jgi:hypothetical protein
MNKTIFWRSNCTVKTSRWALRDYSCYRLAWSKTLIVLLASLLLGPITAWADDSDPWPEQVYFPQKAEQPTSAATSPIKKAELLPVTANDVGSPSRMRLGKMWPFKAKAPKPQQTFRVIPPKPSALLADPPASPYPLLRLPMPIVTEQGVIYPGFYLIKPGNISASTSTGIPGMRTGNEETHPKVELNAESSLLLTRQNQIMARIPIHVAAEHDENMEKTGTLSPITTAVPNLPPIVKVEAQLAPDQKTLRLLVTNGNHHYESDSYPVGTDPRHMLTF